MEHVYQLGEYQVTLSIIDSERVDGYGKDALLSVSVVHIPTHTKVSGSHVPPVIVDMFAVHDIHLHDSLEAFDLSLLGTLERTIAWESFDWKFSGSVAMVCGETVIWESKFESYRQSEKWKPCSIGIVLKPLFTSNFIVAATWILSLLPGDAMKLWRGQKTCDAFLRAMFAGSTGSVSIELQGIYTLMCPAQSEHDDFLQMWCTAGIFSHDFDFDVFIQSVDIDGIVPVKNICIKHSIGEIRLVGIIKETGEHIESADFIDILRELIPVKFR